MKCAAKSIHRYRFPASIIDDSPMDQSSAPAYRSTNILHRRGSVSASDPFGIHAQQNLSDERALRSRLTIVRVVPEEIQDHRDSPRFDSATFLREQKASVFYIIIRTTYVSYSSTTMRSCAIICATTIPCQARGYRIVSITSKSPPLLHPFFFHFPHRRELPSTL